MTIAFVFLLNGQKSGLALDFDTVDSWYWTGATDSWYATASNWQVGGVTSTTAPDAFSTAIIETGTATMLPDSKAAALYIGGAMDAGKAILTANSSYTFDSVGEFHVLENGTLELATSNADDNFAMKSNLYVEGGNITATGKCRTLRLIGASNILESGSIDIRRFSVGYLGAQETVHFTVNGGAITSTFFPVGHGSAGVLTINDGAIVIGQSESGANNIFWQIGNGATGQVFINGGTVNIKNNSTFGSLQIGVGANLAEITQTGGTVHSGTLVFGTNTGSFYKISGGELIVNASITLPETATFLITGGTVTTGNFDLKGNPDFFLGGGNLTITGNKAPTFNICGSHEDTTSTLSLAGGTYSKTLSGNLAITKTSQGLLTLSGENTYTGKTTVTAGTLALTATNAIASSSEIVNNSAITFNADQTFENLRGSGTITGAADLTLNNTIDSTFSGTINLGSGTLTKTGIEQLKLTNTSKKPIQAGKIKITEGNLTIDSESAVFNLSELLIGITGSGGDLDVAQLNVNGAVAFGGTNPMLTLEFDGENPTVNTSVDLVSATDGITGTNAFDWSQILADAGFDSNWTLGITNNGTAITLGYSAGPVKDVPEPGSLLLLLSGILLVIVHKKKLIRN